MGHNISAIILKDKAESFDLFEIYLGFLIINNDTYLMRADRKTKDFYKKVFVICTLVNLKLTNKKGLLRVVQN